MTTKKFYQISLAFPILLPLLFLPAGFYAKDTVLGAISSVLTITLLYGGIPYVLLAIGLLVWMSDKTTEETENGITWSPVLMSIPLSLLAAVIGLAGGGIGGFLVIWFATSLCALFVGYVYVVAVKLFLELLKVTHRVHDAD